MSKLEVREIAPISGETDLKLGQSGGTVTVEGNAALGMAGGYVGIGTSSPENQLHVNGVFRLENPLDSANHSLLYDGGGFVLKSFNNNPMYFYTGNTERVRIDASGNVMVGANILGLSSLDAAYGTKFIKSGTASTILAVHRQQSAGDVAEWGYGANKVGSISVTGTTTTYNTSSDYRLKEDWQPMSGSIDRLKNLNPVNFAWKVDGSRADGFLAHEVQEVVSEAISGIKDAMRTEEYEVTPAVFNDEGVQTTAAVMGTREVPEYQGIDHSKLVPLLTSALQEAVAKIESLEERVAALEAN